MQYGDQTATDTRWGIILAGGEGKRLASLTRRLTGEERPKQFCALIDDTSLLHQTRKRVINTFDPGRVLVVLNRAHQRFYESEVQDISGANKIVQPGNRGTAPAILYALLKLSKISPNAVVALFPSDHFVSNDVLFMHHVDQAFDAVTLRPELTVLLGVEADSPETGYGWIEPGNSVMTEYPHITEIQRFWEKPSREHAENLLARGCLWNSFVIVARVSSLLGMIMMALPELWSAFWQAYPSLGSSLEDKRIGRLYDAIVPSDFSRDVLTRNSVNTSVLPVRGLEWTDLGESPRLEAVLARLGIMPRWNAA